MYDMYPEWGPAAHDPEHPLHQSAHRRTHRRWQPQAGLLTAPDLRDTTADRPDDN